MNLFAALGLVTRDELSRVVDDLTRKYDTKFRTMEARMTTAEQTEAAANEKFAALLGTVIAEIKSLRSNVEAFPGQLAQAIADGDKQRADALAADALRDASRLDAYSDMLSDLYPQDVPTVPVPDPGQPAEPPADSDVEVPEVEEPVVDVPVSEPAPENPPAEGEQV